MQVAGEAALRGGGDWRTGEERVGTCPEVGNNRWKRRLIPHTPIDRNIGGERFIAFGGARVGLACW